MSLQGVGAGSTAAGGEPRPSGNISAFTPHCATRPTVCHLRRRSLGDCAHHNRPRGRLWWPFGPIPHNDCSRGQWWWLRRASPQSPLWMSAQPDRRAAAASTGDAERLRPPASFTRAQALAAGWTPWQLRHRDVARLHRNVYVSRRRRGPWRSGPRAPCSSPRREQWFPITPRPCCGAAPYPPRPRSTCTSRPVRRSASTGSWLTGAAARTRCGGIVASPSPARRPPSATWPRRWTSSSSSFSEIAWSADRSPRPPASSPACTSGRVAAPGPPGSSRLGADRCRLAPGEPSPDARRACRPPGTGGEPHHP